MIDTRNIHSLTDFLRHHKSHVARLRASGQPQVLTVNGRAELVIQDAASYQAMLDRLARAEGRSLGTLPATGAPTTGAPTTQAPSPQAPTTGTEASDWQQILAQVPDVEPADYDRFPEPKSEAS